MPQEPKSYAPPKPNRMRQAYGIPAMSEETTKQYPDFANAWAGREIEMPAEAAATKSVRPMNWLERNTVGRSAAALTWPWGTIAFNPETIKNEKIDPGEMFSHELVHVGQNTSPLGFLKGAYQAYTKDYENQPREAEAFLHTNQRKVRTKDIDLDRKRR